MAHSAIFGIYRDKNEIKNAIHALKKLGFKDKKISVLFPEHEGAKDFAQVQNNELLRGAGYGAFIGVAVVAAFDLLFYAGLINSPSLDALPSLHSSMAITVSVFFGMVIGACCGILVGIGTPEPVAKRYGQYIHAGGILLSVESENLEESEHAKRILEKTGGQDISAAERDHCIKEAVEEMHKLDGA